MAEWWRGAVLYQIYPASFADASGDGWGDLAGITDRLDYVAGLGVDGIWLSPFFPSPMQDFGYDVADYCDVDPRFGSLADATRLIARAHALGLKVIIDQVYSHTSDRHAWFTESRRSRDNARADWYVWADPRPDGTPPNNWLAVFGGGAWTWEPRRRQYYFHNFLAAQPDLNLHHPAVQEAILAVADFWLGLGVDGFRLDVANLYCHDPLLRDNPPSGDATAAKPCRMQRPLYTRNRPETLAFIARLRARLDRWGETGQARMAVAEIAAQDPIGTMATYTNGPDRLHTAYSFVFLRGPLSAAHIRGSVEAMLAQAPDAWPSWAFSNHDVARVASRWGGALAPAACARLLIALLGCLRGTVFLYQGEELGLPEADVPFERLQDPEGLAFWPAIKGRDGCRTPMPWQSDGPHAGFSTAPPWLPVDPRHRALAVDRQQADDASVLAFTRTFLAWRRRRPALVTGAIRFLAAPEPIVAFVRDAEAGAERPLLCVFNLADRPAELALPAAAAAWEAVTAAAPLGGALVASGVRLPPWGGLVAEAAAGGDAGAASVGTHAAL